MSEYYLELEATIPTVQYGNIKPSISLSSDEYGGDWELMRNDGLLKLKSISDMVAGDGYTFDIRGISTNVPSEIKTSKLTNVSVFYDKDSHKYTDKDGNEYISGSVFPDAFYPSFDSKMILEQISKKHPLISSLDISKMWGANGDSSSTFGTAIHTALENYDRFNSIGATLAADGERNKALSKNPLIRAIVEAFHKDRGTEDVESECFVANKEYKLAGTIDRIKFIDREKKIVRIQDFKTDSDINEKRYQVKDSPFKGKIDNTLLGLHFLQLSFYAFILQEAGYTVEGLDVFWLNSEALLSGKPAWETFSSQVIDIKESIKERK